MKIWSSDLDFRDRTQVVRQIRDLCAEYSDIFSFVALFGSTARNEFTMGSDIDLYIESEYLTGTKLLTYKRYREFEYALFDIVLESIDFDLLSYGRNELKSIRGTELYRQVTKYGVILYDKRADDV